MSAFDILHEHYAPYSMNSSEIPAEVLDVLSKHGCAGTIDDEMTDAGAIAMEVYGLGRSRGEGSR